MCTAFRQKLIVWDRFQSADNAKAWLWKFRMLFLFGALSQFHALIRVRVSGGRSVSLSEYGLEQVGTRWNHRNSMVDLQCQGQPAESPEDAASFVSDSSTEDLPESPTDSVSGVSAIRCPCFSSFRLAQPRPTVRGMVAWQATSRPGRSFRSLAQHQLWYSRLLTMTTLRL